MTKRCSKCGESKSLADFYSDKSRRDGKGTRCTLCISAQRQPHRATLARKAREHYAQNVAETALRSRKYREVNKEACLQRCRLYKHNNPGVCKHYNNKRRAAKLQRTPKWLTEAQWRAIKDLYLSCPPGYHVDHIVPLQGKTVSGLHVPWNMQIITAEENLRKSNN